MNYENIKAAVFRGGHDGLVELEMLWVKMGLHETQIEERMTTIERTVEREIRRVVHEMVECEYEYVKVLEKTIAFDRNEIRTLWEECLVGKKDQSLFESKLYGNSEYTLELLENEVAKLREYHDDHKPLLNKIKEYLTYCELAADLKRRTEDPKRLFNRRGGGVDMLQEEKDWKKVKLLPSKRKDLMLVLEKTPLMRVNDCVATELIENEYEKYLQMFPASMNKSSSSVNVTRIPNKSRTNNTHSSFRMFTPKKSNVKKLSQTVVTKSSINLSRDSAAKNTDPACLTKSRFADGISHKLSSKNEDLTFSKGETDVQVNGECVGLRRSTLSYQGLEATISERDFRDNVRLNSTTFDAMEQVKNVDRPSLHRAEYLEPLCLSSGQEESLSSRCTDVVVIVKLIF